MNTPMMQVSFTYTLKISVLKSITISVIAIAKIANTETQNVLNFQITRIRKMSAKLCSTFSNFCKIFLKSLFGS